MIAKYKRLVKYEARLVIWEIILAGIATIILSLIASNLLKALNYELVMQSYVALNSGIVIAIFIALFHGTNKNIEIFKQFRNASRQVYVIFLINSVIVCFVSVLVHNISLKPEIVVLDNQIGFNIFALSIASIVTLKNIYLIYRLLQINFRTP